MWTDEAYVKLHGIVDRFAEPRHAPSGKLDPSPTARPNRIRVSPVRSSCVWSSGVAG